MPRTKRKKPEEDYSVELKEIQDHFLRAQEEALKGIVGLLDLFGQILETREGRQRYESLLRTMGSLEALLRTVIGVLEMDTKDLRDLKAPGKGKKSRSAPRKQAAGRGSHRKAKISKISLV